MGRLCERPGCSEPAAVAYGMRSEDLVFWLDILTNADDVSSGVLCLRHADSMVVPRNWTLDDHRDPDLHLFRPPPGSADRPRANRRPARRRRDTEQLAFGVETEPTDEVSQAVAAAPTDTWTPAFDVADDLGGLLSAKSPLLARAFRGDDRPKG